jgi:hypothetical protein
MNKNTEIIIDMIRSDLTEVKKDVKSLLSFKWKVIGFITAYSSFISILVSIFVKKI